jgi:hypothetical protein
MLVIHTAKADFVVRLVMLDDQRAILLAEALERA